MQFSKREMQRRTIVFALQSRITDIVGEFVTDGPDGITFIEVIACLHEAMGRNIKELLRDEWKDC